MHGRVKAKPERVEVVADRIVIWLRELVENLEDFRIRPNPKWVERLHARRRKFGDLGIGPGRICELQIGENAITEIGSGHDAHNRFFARIAATFIIEKEEKLVLLDRPAERSAKNITEQLRTRHSPLPDFRRAGLDGKITRHKTPRLIVKPFISRGDCIAMIFIDGAVVSV